MDTVRSTSLRMPAFLYGREEESAAAATREGERCAEQYRKDGTLPLPQVLVEVPAGEVVVLRDRVDFGWGQPRWRLHHLSKVRSGLWEDPPRKDSPLLAERLERLYLGTPWGALYFMLAHRAPQSAEREAARLEAVLRFWEPLQSVRYLYDSPGEPLGWEELMERECDWVLTAWSPEEGGSVRERLEKGARRMARATREECVEAILRQVPGALAAAHPLHHREALADLELWRARLAAMGPASLLELSSAWPSPLSRMIYRWDKQLDGP
jgi:hypothetical protein